MAERRPDGEFKESGLDELAESARRKKAKEEAAKAEAGKEAGDDENEDAGEDSEAPRDRTPDSSRVEAGERAREEFQRRVALAEVASRLDDPEEARFIREAVEQHGGEWYLERGRYLLSRLVRTEAVAVGAQTVRIEQRYAILEDGPPKPPKRLAERIKAAVKDSEEGAEPAVAFAEVRAEVRPKDEVVVTLDAPGAPERRFRITPEAVVEVDVEDEARQSAVLEGQPQPRELREVAQTIEPDTDRPVEAIRRESSPAEETAAIESSGEEETGRDHPEALPDDTDATFNELLERVWEEADTEGATPVIETEIEEAGQTKEPGASGREPQPMNAPETGTDEIPREDQPEPTPETAEADSFPEALDRLSEHIVEVSELPPVRGGSGERPPAPLDRRDDRRMRRRPPRARYDARRGIIERVPPMAIPPSRRAEMDIFVQEREWREPRRLPDARMRRKAKTLVRLLARRYGLKLTAEIEVYLMEILLRPGRAGDRVVYGLGLHREELLRVLETLWLNYGDLYAIRPQE